jgi:hypothetical protein
LSFFWSASLTRREAADAGARDFTIGCIGHIVRGMKGGKLRVLAFGHLVFGSPETRRKRRCMGLFHADGGGRVASQAAPGRE